ncbi:MAG: ATP-binding protein [Clostridia bacterium]|nr:ATP-binding protein [Clostridia bacterium]
MIGRKEELKKLRSLLEEEESQFVAVFGRRRIGKTMLIRESFNYQFTFQHTGLSNNTLKSGDRKQAQLDQFAISLAEAGYRPEEKLRSWSDAFSMLKQVICRSKEKKKVIFLDELSWMDTNGSDLIPALEHFWNGWVTARREKDVVLIICASATYWMIDRIVNAKGGLHNRLSGQIHLKPFTLGECEEYLKSRKIILNRHQILQCYMILGGVPYYWSLLEKGKSLPQNIDALFFREGAVLQNEYQNLYSALFSRPEQYMKIIETLSQVNQGITRDEISKRSGIPVSGNLSKKLEELESSGFIRKYIPYGYQKRNCLYQLLDNYTLFYFKFIQGRAFAENYWSSKFNSPEIHAWSGVAFERVCLEHIPQIKRALGISGVLTEVNAWKCNPDPDQGIQGSQIDLLIVRRDQIINLCEMKYTESDYYADAAFDRAQKRKISDFQKKTGTKYAIHSTLITPYGVGSNAYSGEIQSVITAEDLFADSR